MLQDKIVFLFGIILLVNSRIIRESTVQVPWGETVTLICESNDANHNFFYWYVNEKEIVIGPSNHYDNRKFKYEVLSGNLTIKAVSKDEEGIYNCVSRGIREDDVQIRSTRIIVKVDWEEVFEEDPNEISEEPESNSLKDKITGVLFGVALPKFGEILTKIRDKRLEFKANGDFGECPVSNLKFQKFKVNLFRVAVVLGTLILVSGVGYAGYRIWKSRYRHPSYIMADDDDEDSTEELFTTPSTSRTKESILKNNSTDSFENPGLSTDFTSILDTARNK